MTKLQTYCIVFLFCAAAVITLPAQSILFSTLANFNGTNGAFPGDVPPVQARDGNFYGTTSAGGAHSNSMCLTYPAGCGTAFKMTPGGVLSTLYSFCSSTNCADGAVPVGLVRGSDGNFWGTTSGGGTYGNYGTFFTISSTGALTTLHSFDGADGSSPAIVVQATDGNFYGTTSSGGAYNAGTIFKISPNYPYVLTPLYSFCSQTNCADGYYPLAGLVQGSDGNFYGTTYFGGANDAGVVFKITATGALTTLYSFCSQANCADGANPVAGLVQGADGNFYGTAYMGGGNTSCTYGCGTVFKISPEYPYTLTRLHSFDNADGYGPTGSPVQGTDGNFYDTTIEGGAYLVGTVFKISPEYPYPLTTLHSFEGADGNAPVGGVMQAPDGFFYGTTQQGGPYSVGTVFRLLPVRACATCGP